MKGFAFLRSIALLIVSLAAAPAAAEVRPDEVAVIANRTNADSLAIARHYATRRHIPPTHLIELDLPDKETIGRSEYRHRLIEPLRQILERRALAATVHVLVTTYGVPLRVDAPKPSKMDQSRLTDATERRRFARGYLETIPSLADHIAPIGAGKKEEPKTSPETTGGDDALLEYVNRSLQDAARRLEQARTQSGHDIPQQDAQRFAQLVLQAGGSTALISNLQVPPSSADPQRRQQELDRVRQEAAVVQRMAQVLIVSSDHADRRHAYDLIQSVFGLIGVLHLANAEIQRYGYSEADASVDNELALLWWDDGDYQLAGRIPNPFYYQALPAIRQETLPLPILMVSRLDAPSPQLARRLVDQAIAAEADGLHGKVYVDARGLKPDGKLSYGDYDEGLRQMAEMFTRSTSYPVVLEDTERRFSRPDEAPDVAVYVGWYKLRSYEDAFSFNQGAIGYHIASGEAVSIHDPDEPGWCKNALERGITATLGSIGEPYLDAFPMPNHFLSLLLTGRYNLVEAYSLTSRYLSWRMVLFGDPLYNPWRGRGVVREEDTVLANRSPTIAPMQLPFPDPLVARRNFVRQRERALADARAYIKALERKKNKSGR